MFRGRDGHKTQRALTGLCSLRARALIERQPERRPESEDGECRHDEKPTPQPTGARSLAADRLVASRWQGLSHGR